MTEWGVFEVFGAIVGVFIAIGVPSLKLNSAVTRLETVLKAMESRAKEDRTLNSEEHVALWEELDKQNGTINDHETRLCVIEKGGIK